MADIERGSDGLPITTEKELAAMNQLLSDRKYKIKLPPGFFHGDKKNLINPDFILYTLNDFLGHIQNYVVSTRRMIPGNDTVNFIPKVESFYSTAAGIFTVAINIDLKTLSSVLGQLQKSARNISLPMLLPFIKILYKSLIRIYYLPHNYTADCYRTVYTFITAETVPADPQALKDNTLTAIQELQYIYTKVFPTLYPLVLRMVSPVFLSEKDLFYKNGSKVLAWLGVDPKEILLPKPREKDVPSTVKQASVPKKDEKAEREIPSRVFRGLEYLEKLFPEAGWHNIPEFPEYVQDFAPYFSSLLQLSESFIQLSPSNPLHLTMILFQILAELFQGLRHATFNIIHTGDGGDLPDDDIYHILDDWILYKVSIFDKNFSEDLKSYTHQIYTQPDFGKTPYAQKLMSNMYSLIRHYFMPFFDTQLYGFQKLPKDPRLPPLFSRVARLRVLLENYMKSVEKSEAVAMAKGGEPGSSGGDMINAFDNYRFDIPNMVSRRLDALCGGKNSANKTNAVLLRYSLSILSVLDWWINDPYSPAYKIQSESIYRTVEAGGTIPAFGVTPRTDTDEIFKRHLRKSFS